MPGPPDRDVALAKLLCGVLDDILNPDLLFALVGPLPPPPQPLTIGGATPPWGKLPRDGWATSDIINQAVFCYFSFYFFAIFLDLHANILRDSARSYIWNGGRYRTEVRVLEQPLSDISKGKIEGNVDGCRIPTNDKLGAGAENPAIDAVYKAGGWDRPWMHDEAAPALGDS